MSLYTMNCTCCSLLTWDYITPRHYIIKKRDKRKAGGILIFNGRVLIVQSRGNKWGFPKGGFEKGENAVQCAKREVYEETSFNIAFTDNDMKFKCKHTTFFVIYLQNKPPNINKTHMNTPGNDCTGIGWVRLTCLEKLVNTEKRVTELTRKLKTMTLHNSHHNSDESESHNSDESESDNSDESQQMEFNLGIRKFVKQYMNRQCIDRK